MEFEAGVQLLKGTVMSYNILTPDPKPCFLRLMYIYINRRIMARQSISLTEPNDLWLKSQVNSKEYSSKRELVNDLIRQARSQQKQID